MNGSSALLHLVRASLKYYSKDAFSSQLLFDPSKMNNMAGHKPDSAPKVLTDENNKEMAIYPGRSERFEVEEAKQKGGDVEDSKTQKKRSYYLFEDLVEQHYSILEQIMDHHISAAGQNGVNLKLRVRKHLEGWDFRQLATSNDPRPRVATLRACGYGWVDFIRSIDAITLFGPGFGDIIQPIESDGMCPLWKSLPTQNYYLAASAFDLKDIMENFGSKWTDPPSLVHDLLWHCPGDMVAPCRCQGYGSRQIIRTLKSHHDPVQVLYPSWSRLNLFKSLKAPNLERLKDSGAVVFGHSVAWRYHWREHGRGDLDEGDPPFPLPIHPPPPVPDTDHQIATVSTRSSSGSARLSIVGRSSGVMTTSSLSANTTPDESTVDSAHALNSIEPNPASDTTSPSRQTVRGENRLPTLRREKRRLQIRGR